MADQDNREELKDRIRKIKSDIAIFDRPEAKDSVWMVSAIEALLKDSEVTIDSGADVCEWVEGDRLYETSCNEVSYNYDRSWEFCPYCGKKITIKGE